VEDEGYEYSDSDETQSEYESDDGWSQMDDEW